MLRRVRRSFAAAANIGAERIKGRKIYFGSQLVSEISVDGRLPPFFFFFLSW